MKIITERLPPETHNQWVGIDLEMFDMNDKQLHRPTSGRFALMSIAIGENVYIIDKESHIQDALKAVENNWWVFQNAKFDITQLRRYVPVPPRNRLWDTMLIERILYGGYYDTFALDDLVRRHLFIHMEKELQKSFTGNEISSDQVRYSAMDAYVLPKIVKSQKRISDKDDFNIWMNVDLPALWAFLDFQGFAINVEAWKELALKNERRQEMIDAELPINPRSPKQVVEYLRSHGLKVQNSRAETIEKAISKHPKAEGTPVAMKILDSRMYSKRASTYGMNFIEDFLEKDEFGNDMIYGCYWVTGAETGRIACSDPNMTNIPARDTKEYRESFIARPGNKLLIADYSAQEMFIVAYASGDPVLIEICNSGNDVYIEATKRQFGMEITKQDPMRDKMKALLLGGNYGMSIPGLARRMEISLEEAEEIVAKRRKTFPVLEEYMTEQAKQKKQVKTIAGRKIWLNRYSGQCPRNALNGPIQGSAADCMKQALGNLHHNWISHFPISFPVVGYIHDEVVSDVPEEYAQDIADHTERVMVETANNMFPGLNFKAHVSIADTWAGK